MPKSSLARRTFIRGAGVALALPFLDAMRPRLARAATDVRRFVAFFAPNGSDPGLWQPKGQGALTAANLTPSLQDLKGFGAEKEWPSATSLVAEVTAVTGCHHDKVCFQIHNPAMALCAHANNGASPVLPMQPTLDQYMADRIGQTTAFRTLAISPSTFKDAEQAYISFRANGQAETPYRKPADLFDALFTNRSETSEAIARVRRRRASILDLAREDAARLNRQLGREDQQRVTGYLEAVFELEKQLMVGEGSTCTAPSPPAAAGAERAFHTQWKQLIDLAVLALSCDLTRIVTLQYSDSWNLNFRGFDLGDGVGDWSDHFISHKLGDRDRATDLDDLPQDQAIAIANARVLQTSRFKVRRFAYLLDRLRAVTGANGTLLDESLVLYTSEHGDGDSHLRTNMPILVAGRAGGFRPGRIVSAGGAQTGSLHASLLNYMGIETASYGDPAGSPIAGL